MSYADLAVLALLTASAYVSGMGLLVSWIDEENREMDGRERAARERRRKEDAECMKFKDEWRRKKLRDFEEEMQWRKQNDTRQG